MAVYDLDREKEYMHSLIGYNREITGRDYSRGLAVKCHNGTFVGREKDGVRSYKGIPFAVPPVGKRRWKAPQMAAENSGVYEAYYFGRSCIQTEEASERASLYIQGEDCLTLNIWTDASGKPDGRPVMVFMHGGAFGWGGSADPLYDGQKFVGRNRGIVLVTVNYRIGLFGFMNFEKVRGGEEYRESGNLGLLDQICALRWVKENIRAFGGDPENVTVFGESAGAASVSLLPLIDSAKGLFGRVIAESGSIAFTYSKKEAATLTDSLLKLTGASSMADLAALSEDEIIQVNKKLNLLNNFPVRDGLIIPEDLYEAYESGKSSDIDMLIGTNADETRYWIGEVGSYFLYQALAPFLVKGLMARLSHENRKRARQFIRTQKNTRVWNLTEFYNELVFRVPAVVQASSHADNGGNTYMYYWTKPSAIPHYGACHAVELAYVFGNTGDTIYTGEEADQNLSETVQDMWVSFASTGDPGTKEHPWQQYQTTDRMTMLLGDEIRMVSDLKGEQREMIEPILDDRYNGNYDNTGLVLNYLKRRAIRIAGSFAIAGAATYGAVRLLEGGIFPGKRND